VHVLLCEPRPCIQFLAGHGTRTVIHAPNGQAVSLRYREVLRFLLNMASRFGQVFPALTTIAATCSCSVKTVSNALAWLKTWGFLTWRRRLKANADLVGRDGPPDQQRLPHCLVGARLNRRRGVFLWVRS
jgi:hypothetical protein